MDSASESAAGQVTGGAAGQATGGAAHDGRSADLVLLTGATGFVGRALLPALLAAGKRVRCLSRDVERARQALGAGVEAEAAARCEWVAGDIGDLGACGRALVGCDAAYFLVHGMADGADYLDRELAAAQTFVGAAARAGIRRIVYLGGVAPSPPARRESSRRAAHDAVAAATPYAGASAHLHSRLRVGELLRAGPVPTLELRSSMIVGYGSLSWQIVRDLAARLPFMVLPRWLKSRTEPVAIDDIVIALARALDVPVDGSAWFDVPGPAVLSGREILEQTAEAMGLTKPRIIEVGMLSPRLSSQWIRLVTRADWTIARELVVGLTEDLLAHDHRFWELIGHAERLGFGQAAQRALLAERLDRLSSANEHHTAWDTIERALQRALGRGVSS